MFETRIALKFNLAGEAHDCSNAVHPSVWSHLVSYERHAHFCLGMHSSNINFQWGMPIELSPGTWELHTTTWVENSTFSISTKGTWVFCFLACMPVSTGPARSKWSTHHHGNLSLLCGLSKPECWKHMLTVRYAKRFGWYYCRNQDHCWLSRSPFATDFVCADDVPFVLVSHAGLLRPAGGGIPGLGFGAIAFFAGTWSQDTGRYFRATTPQRRGASCVRKQKSQQLAVQIFEDRSVWPQIWISGYDKPDSLTFSKAQTERSKWSISPQHLNTPYEFKKSL